MEHDSTPATADSIRDGSAFTEGLGPNATEFDKYAFMMDFDITRSTCGGRAGRYASEVTQRAYMVWSDQQREILRLREHAVILAATAEEVERERWNALLREHHRTHQPEDDAYYSSDLCTRTLDALGA